MTDEKAKALRERLDLIAKEVSDLAYGTFDSLLSDAVLWREKYFVANAIAVKERTRAEKVEAELLALLSSEKPL